MNRASVWLNIFLALPSQFRHGEILHIYDDGLVLILEECPPKRHETIREVFASHSEWRDKFRSIDDPAHADADGCTTLEHANREDVSAFVLPMHLPFEKVPYIDINVETDVAFGHFPDWLSVLLRDFHDHRFSDVSTIGGVAELLAEKDGGK